MIKFPINFKLINILRCMSYFQLSSWCLEKWSYLSCLKYYFFLLVLNSQQYQPIACCFIILKCESSLTRPEDSILEAVLTVSPNKQYLGIFKPTTPATTIPVCTPTSWHQQLAKRNWQLFLYNCNKNGSEERWKFSMKVAKGFWFEKEMSHSLSSSIIPILILRCWDDFEGSRSVGMADIISSARSATCSAW